MKKDERALAGQRLLTRNTLAVLLIEEYDKLMEILEDARDAAALEAFARALAAGHVETIPAEVAEAILDGENPVRVLRAWRGFTLKQMGEACGVTDAHISQIETGKRSMSVATLKKLAGALNVDVELLL